jgi:cyclase
VASGGAGAPEHLADAVERGGADAVLAAGIFHFGQCTIREVKDLFVRRGIPVRPAC